MADPPLYEEYEVLKRLKLRASELFDLLNVGIIAPVARRGRDPMYCATTIDALQAMPQPVLSRSLRAADS